MHTPLPERQAHIELWRGSGLSKAAYCREAGLPYHRLVSWCRSLEGRCADSDPGFDLVDVYGPGEDEAGRLTVQVGTATLQFPAGTDPHWVAGVVRAVVPC